MTDRAGITSTPLAAHVVHIRGSAKAGNSTAAQGIEPTSSQRDAGGDLANASVAPSFAENELPSRLSNTTVQSECDARFDDVYCKLASLSSRVTAIQATTQELQAGQELAFSALSRIEGLLLDNRHR